MRKRKKLPGEIKSVLNERAIVLIGKLPFAFILFIVSNHL
jgi:hypothetical protein